MTSTLRRCTDGCLSLCHGLMQPNEYAMSDEELCDDWFKKRRDSIMPRWISEHPGTRPPRWWAFEQLPVTHEIEPFAGFRWAITMRAFYGGVGAPEFMCLCQAPNLVLGLPFTWVQFHSGDLPRFESQASFLRRYQLLTKAERRRLMTRDYAPECLLDSADSVFSQDPEILARVPGARRALGFHDFDQQAPF